MEDQATLKMKDDREFCGENSVDAERLVGRLIMW